MPFVIFLVPGWLSCSGTLMLNNGTKGMPNLIINGNSNSSNNRIVVKAGPLELLP
jgi:hypothetical protein